MSEYKGISLESSKAQAMKIAKAKPTGKGFPVTSKIPACRPSSMKNRTTDKRGK